MRTDHRKFPGECSGLLHRNAHNLGAAARAKRGRNNRGKQHANKKFHDPLSRFLERLLFSRAVIA
jgi:hypothetical protein